MELQTLFLCVFIGFFWVHSTSGQEAEASLILNRVRSDYATLKWLETRHNAQQKQNAFDKNVLQLHLHNENTSISLELERNRDLVHPKLITRVVNNGSSSVHKKTVWECLHQGSVIGLVTSRVMVTGCSKTYRGYIFHEGKTWVIRPRRRGSKTMVLHTVSRVRSESLKSTSPCPVDTPSDWTNHHQFDGKRSRERHKRNADVKILELYVVFNHGTYTKYLKSDKKNAETYATEMAGHLDTIYKFDVGVRIALVGVEVWETKEEITMLSDAKDLLSNFINYGKKSLTSFKYDLAALVADENFDYNIAGMAHVDVMCSPLSAAVIKHVPGAVNPHLKSAVSLAHEVGHALGLVHDTSKCACADRTGKCIMAADTSSDPQSFSQCSKDALSKMFREGGASCLYDAPPHVYGGPICGNGVKELGEVCDCGDIAECLRDVCCKYGCQLKPTAQCNSGGCCKNCQIVQAGMICRAKQNECDLEEFCDGIKSECPDNLHLPDMGKCGGAANSGFCYKGKCRHPQAQCEYLWGPGSTAAYPGCYQANTQGTVTGNCGASRSAGSVTFKKCDIENSMCGMIQCVTKKRSPQVGVSRQIINTTMGQHRCISVAIDLGDDVPDPGLVDDGSPCIHVSPSNKQDGVCLSGKCVILQTVPKTKCPANAKGEECDLHGTCTNDGSCFCDDGYTGLDCSQRGGVTRIRPSTTPTTLKSSSPSTALPPSTSITSQLPGTPSVSPLKPETSQFTSPSSFSTSTFSSTSTSAPTEQRPKDHVIAIICGVLGGLMGLSLLLCVLWRCKKPKSFWEWLENKFGKKTTAPQKKPSTAWGEHNVQSNGKPHVTTNNQVKPKPSVLSLPGVIPVPTPGRPDLHRPFGHSTGRPELTTSHWFTPPGHLNNHGRGHTNGHGQSHSNGRGRGHDTGRSRGRGRRQGQTDGYSSKRISRFSTSDYGSQESIESIKLDYGRGPSVDALPGEVTMTPARRFSSIN